VRRVRREEESGREKEKVIGKGRQGKSNIGAKRTSERSRQPFSLVYSISRRRHRTRTRPPHRCRRHLCRCRRRRRHRCHRVITRRGKFAGV